MNIGEFIELLRQTEIIESKLWLEELQAKFTEDIWDQLINLPLDRTNLIRFAKHIAVIIQLRIVSIGTQDLYDETLKTGHAFLQKIHSLAQKQGIEIELTEIDVSLSMTEMMVAAGMVEVKNGMVNLTAKGEEAADSVAKEIAGGK